MNIHPDCPVHNPRVWMPPPKRIRHARPKLPAPIQTAAFVQQANHTGAGPVTQSTVTGLTITAGNTLVVSGSWINATGTDITSVSDFGVGDTFTRGLTTVTQGTAQMGIFYCLSSNGGVSANVRVNLGVASTNVTIGYAEYSGLTSFDTGASGTNAGSSAAATSAFVPGGSGRLVACHGWTSGTNGWTQGAGYTARYDLAPLLIEDRINAPAGSQTAVATADGTTSGCCCIVEPWILMALAFAPPATPNANNATMFGTDA